MGCSQLLSCSGEQTLPGSLQVMMPKAAQSREIWSKPLEAEIRSSPGENVQNPGYPSARHFRGKGNIPLLCPDVVGREDFWRGGDTLPRSSMEPVSSLLPTSVM